MKRGFSQYDIAIQLDQKCIGIWRKYWFYYWKVLFLVYICEM